MRERFLAQLRADAEGFLSAYSARFGNVLNADSAATLFAEYNRNPAEYREAVHPAATWIRDELFSRALERRTGDDRIVFMAGGNAAGKSTAVRVGRIADEATVVVDSTLSNPTHAERLIQMALMAEWRITIVHIDRPVDDAFRGMLQRSRTEGRVVTIRQLMASQRGAVESMRVLWDALRQNPRVVFKLLNNSLNSVEVRRDVGAIPAQEYNADCLHGILDHEFESGRITAGIYRRIGGGNPESQERGTGGR
jgi:hypothetical protein